MHSVFENYQSIGPERVGMHEGNGVWHVYFRVKKRFLLFVTKSNPNRHPKNAVLIGMCKNVSKNADENLFQSASKTRVYSLGREGAKEKGGRGTK